MACSRAVERMREELDTLTEKQLDFLRTATYLGMRPEDAKEYDERRSRIAQLMQAMAALETAA